MRYRTSSEVHSARDVNEGSACKQQKKTRGTYFVIFPLIFIFALSNEENITDINAEETVATDSSKHILKYLENSEKGS